MKKSTSDAKKSSRGSVGREDGQKICFGRDLAKALRGVELSPEEARAWYRELQAARKALEPQGNVWSVRRSQNSSPNRKKRG